MSITSELRGWKCNIAADLRPETVIALRCELNCIADRIDAEHQKAMDEWKARDGQMWLKGYSECRAEIAEGNDAIVADLEANGWVRLPLDADGVPIHIGDRLTDGEYTFTVCELATFRDGSWSIRNEDGNAWAACDVTHHALTVEDVLDEFFGKANLPDGTQTRAEIIAEYAAKLRLAEGMDA